MKIQNCIRGVVFFAFCCPMWAHAQVSPVSISRPRANKIDIILLQDESGSMKRTDPWHIRKLVARTLIEGLEVAGEGNRMALILFGTRAEVKVPLSRDFEHIKQFSEKGFPPHPGSDNQKSLEAVSERRFTDIYSAIEAASQLLLKEKKAKGHTSATHVILLTDGDMDPWPGRQRYGDVAKGYLDCLERASHQKICHDRFKNKAAGKDKQALFEKGGLLSLFKKNGWRIHCLGFSNKVDITLLKRISAATYGHAGVAPDYTKLLQILKEIIPPAPNTITLVINDFCDTRRIEEPVTIDQNIITALFKIDLNRMLGTHANIRPENLYIKLTGPKGEIISSEKDDFKFNTTNNGLVVSATYLLNNPSVGRWDILVKGLGKNICGRLEVTGKVPFEPEMNFVPELSTYYGEQDVGIKVSLKNSVQKQDVPMRKVEGNFSFCSEGSDQILFNKPIFFRIRPDGLSAEADLKIPLNKKGTAAIETSLVDQKYGSKFTCYRKIKIAPTKATVSITASPEHLQLGVLGDDKNTVSASLNLGTRDPVYKVDMIKPKLSCAGQDIPSEWVRVTPSSGTLSPDKPLSVSVSVTLPGGIPLTLSQGHYKGELVVEPRHFAMEEGYGKIPVDLQLLIPETFVEPRNLAFDFKWRLCDPIIKEIRIGHNSVIDREIHVSTPSLLKDRNGELRKGLVVELADKDRSSLDIDAGAVETLKVQARLTNTSLHKKQRIPRGTYKGEIEIRSPGMRTKTMEISIKIPEKPYVLYIRKAGKYVIGFFSLMVLFGIIRFIYTGRKHCFRGKTYSVPNSMLQKDISKFEFEITTHESTDPYGGRVIKHALPSGGPNNDVQVCDPNTGDFKAVSSSSGLLYIDDFQGSGIPVDRIETPRYSYRIIPGAILKVQVMKGPFGSVGWQFFKWIFIWAMVAAIAAGLTFWAYRIC